MTLAWFLAAADPDDPFVDRRATRDVADARTAIRSNVPSNAHQRDTTWVERIRAGDRTAFAELYREYLSAMLGFTFRIVRSAAVAEDLCADIFVSLWERRATWTPQHGARAYLFHAVRSRALNHLRDRATTARLQKGQTEENARALGAGMPVIPIDEHLDDEQKLHAVRAAIASMPEIRRRVMELRWQHELSIPEITVVMGLSRAAVDQHLSRGLRTLKELLPRTFA